MAGVMIGTRDPGPEGGTGYRWFPAALAALLALLLPCATSASEELSATGADGVAVTLERPAARIVSLSPHLTELLYAAGAGKRVVGVVAHSDHPPQASELPRVGDAFRLDLERIAALEPDLAVAWQSGNPGEAVERLRTLGIPVLVTEAYGLDDIADQLRQLGRLAGSSANAHATAARFEARIGQLRREYAGRDPVPVFYQAASRPLHTVGGRHVISEVIGLCGGRNVFADQDSLAPSVSVEAVLGARPRAIIAGAGVGVPDPLARWRKRKTLPAVALGHLYEVPADLMHRATPRIAEGAEMLCGHIERTRTETPDPA